MRHLTAWPLLVALMACGTGPMAKGTTFHAVEPAADQEQNAKIGARAARLVSLRIDAAGDLNAADTGQGTAVIVRVYQLRSEVDFLSAPYGIFGNTDKEKAALGSGLGDVRELVLRPGHTLKIVEKVNSDTTHIGVITFFHRPSAQRWRMAFSALEAERVGLVLGAHACAMTSGGAVPSGMRRADVLLLSTVPCL